MPTYTVTVKQEITVSAPTKAAAKELVEEFPPQRYVASSKGRLRTHTTAKVLSVKEQAK